MIRRLVEQQQVRLREQDLGQLDPHVPTLAERLGPAPEVLVLESESEQRLLRKDLNRLILDYRQGIREIVQAVDESQI